MQTVTNETMVKMAAMMLELMMMSLDDEWPDVAWDNTVIVCETFVVTDESDMEWFCDNWSDIK